MKFFDKKPTAGEFTTLFAGVNMTNSDIYLQAGSKAAFSDMGFNGRITGAGDVVSAQSGEVHMHVANSTLVLTTMVGVNKLVIGENATVRITSSEEARLRFDEIVLAGPGASLVIEAGVLAVHRLTVSKGAQLRAAFIESPALTMEPGAKVVGHVSTEFTETKVESGLVDSVA